jgi:hypothetical protein
MLSWFKSFHFIKLEFKNEEKLETKRFLNFKSEVSSKSYGPVESEHQFN